MPEIIRQVGSYVRGWNAYFGLAQAKRTAVTLGAWIRRRLRAVMWYQWRNNWRRVDALLAAGADRNLTFIAVKQRWKGPWAAAHHPVMDKTFDTAYFHKMGLPEVAFSPL